MLEDLRKANTDERISDEIITECLNVFVFEQIYVSLVESRPNCMDTQNVNEMVNMLHIDSELKSQMIESIGSNVASFSILSDL